MILKSFELSKIKLDNYKFYLFYGNNEGLKEEHIKNLYPRKVLWFLKQSISFWILVLHGFLLDLRDLDGLLCPSVWTIAWDMDHSFFHAEQPIVQSSRPGIDLA